MMEKRNIEVLGISETRDKITARRVLHNNYVYFKSSEVNGKHRVSVIVSENIGQYVSSFECVNKRLVKISVRTQRQKLAILQIYAPQHGRPKAEEDFFNILQQVINTCNPDKETIVMGDFNGHVGQDRHFSIGNRNEQGKQSWIFVPETT